MPPAVTLLALPLRPSTVAAPCLTVLVVRPWTGSVEAVALRVGVARAPRVAAGRVVVVVATTMPPLVGALIVTATAIVATEATTIGATTLAVEARTATRVAGVATVVPGVASLATPIAGRLIEVSYCGLLLREECVHSSRIRTHDAVRALNPFVQDLLSA